jgi:hypothetical protein
MHHTMTVAALARTVTKRWLAVAVKSDVKTGHDIAYVTRGHASGCTGAMAYYTSSGEPTIVDHNEIRHSPIERGTWRANSQVSDDN